MKKAAPLSSLPHYTPERFLETVPHRQEET